MFRTWLAEGTSTLLTLGVPALLATILAAALVYAVRLAGNRLRQLPSLRPSPLVVVRVTPPPTPAGGPAGRRGRVR